MEGSLQSLSLASLIQMICLEERTAALHLDRHGQEGVIYIERGEIAHASAGSLSGEEAVYQLIGWKEGNFRALFDVSIPRRSITTPWSHLLLEGSRRIDEQQRAASGSANGRRMLSEAELEHDSAFENDMIVLLSELEFLRAQLEEKKARTQPSLALKVLSEILNRVVALSDQPGDGRADLESLEEILAMTGRSVPGARMVRTSGNQVSEDTVSEFARLKIDRRARLEAFQQIAEALTIVTESYLARLTERFRSGPVADQWRETYRAFLEELNQAIENVED